MVFSLLKTGKIYRYKVNEMSYENRLHDLHIKAHELQFENPNEYRFISSYIKDVGEYLVCEDEVRPQQVVKELEEDGPGFTGVCRILNGLDELGVADRKVSQGVSSYDVSGFGVDEYMEVGHGVNLGVYRDTW